ncbi:MAG: PBP1A family penicillin-binding protein [Nitrospirae bacterium]|nr:PBP1A family penicillin-binding protein [Candidatus Troglogloeales bacterium]
MTKKPLNKAPWKRWGKVVLLAILSLGIAVCGLAGGVLYYFSQDLPELNKLKHYEPSQATRVYSDDHRVIGQFYTEKRIFVPLAEMPPEMFQAILAVEDARFYEHKGFDTFRIIGAFLRNLEGFEVRQGASTITQQITRALFLTPEKTFSRKIKEILLARRIESVLTKDQILELYLNQIYFGEGAYGVAVAARTYFGKELKEIYLGEAAFLAGLPKGPNNYSPYEHLNAGINRQRVVLKRMREEGYITQTQYDHAVLQKLVFKEKSIGEENIAPYFNEYLRQYLITRYGADLVYKGGMNIDTPLNITMQQAAENALRKGLEDLDKRQGYRNKSGHRGGAGPPVEGAVVVLDPQTGSVKAMVGGYDFRRSEFNRALQARRQPGSAFKPIIFGTAIERGFTPASIVVDNPVIFENAGGGKIWKPENYANKFYGPISLREALTYSRNLATINLLEQVGVSPVIEFATRLGIRSPLTHDLTLALGSSGVSLLELTSAYAVFANRGLRIRPTFYVSIKDHTQKILAQREVVPVQAISEETAYVVTNMLIDVIQKGTASKANFIDRPIAGKTGTTNNFIDAWFIGYTPNLVVGVWVGFDEEQTLGDKESGGSAALPIWIDFMKEILPGVVPEAFPTPENVVYAKIDPSTGLLMPPSEENGKMEVFVKGTEPKKYKIDVPRPVQFFKLDEEPENL